MGNQVKGQMKNMKLIPVNSVPEKISYCIASVCFERIEIAALLSRVLHILTIFMIL